jgi:DNA-binding MarR family transcriptional regulator
MAFRTGGDLCIPRGAFGRAPLLLAGAGDLLLRGADETLAESGLDGRAYSILSIIDTDGPGTQQELARLLNKAPPIVVAAIDDLEARGLVTRTRDPADRRRSRVTMTDAGAAALGTADRLADAAFDELFRGLGADELTQLRDLLARGLQPVMAASPPATAARSS